MYQPEPTSFLQLSTGFAIPQSFPGYAFDETQLRLSDGRGAAAPGSGGNAASALFYETSLFNAANSAVVGPAPSAPSSFDLHTNSPPPTTTSAATATSTVTAPPHPQTSIPISLKMEANADDLAAQEAAAREYQPQPVVCIFCSKANEGGV